MKLTHALVGLVALGAAGNKERASALFFLVA
jgi:hypothetical protein